jgi:hypothetical protein
MADRVDAIAHSRFLFTYLFFLLHPPIFVYIVCAIWVFDTYLVDRYLVSDFFIVIVVILI